MTAVLGGGVSGLAATHYLLKSASQKVTVIERSNVFGGWISSVRYPDEGFIFEKGPRTVRPKGPQGLNTLALVEELNLTKKVSPILRSHPTAKNRMIYVDKKLHVLPSDISSLVRTCSPFSRPILYSALTDLRAPSTDCDDESIYSFVERRFGVEVADYLISPMICGICAGDAREISVKFLLAESFEWEKRYGSVLKGLFRKLMSKPDKKTGSDTESPLGLRALQEKWSVWMMRDGLQQLPEALGKSVQARGAKIKFNSVCTKLEFPNKNQVTCVVNDSAGITLNGVFEHVICSLPATTLARLVSEQHPTLSKELSNIESVTVAVVNLAFKGNHLKYNAFGFLTPPKEQLPILGVIFDSCSFEYKNWTVLTVMMGGRWYDKYFGALATEETILEVALKQVSDILGITEEPDKSHVSILRDCIPQYTVGHHERVRRILTYIKEHNLPLTVIGSSYFGVGLNDVIYSARNAIEDLHKKR